MNEWMFNDNPAQTWFGYWVSKVKIKYVYINISLGYKHSVKSCLKCITNI